MNWCERFARSWDSPQTTASDASSKAVLTRREFFGAGGLAFAAFAIRPGPCEGSSGLQPRVTRYPFTLGVSSGDPSASGIVLWTRLAPDPLNGGGMPPRSVQVQWEVAEDDQFRLLVKRGTATAPYEFAHSVHVEVDGLRPNRAYFYRFIYGDATSATGRTRTTPADGMNAEQLRFAFVSCQHYEDGYFTAYRHLASEDIAFVIHLGDYIYTTAERPGRVRSHASGECVALEDYRRRFALYQSDPDLQAAHAAAPFVVLPDDNDVLNDFAGGDAGVGATEPSRRRAAYQAFYEHLPLRTAWNRRRREWRLYRRMRYGRLADFIGLDTRQYRSSQPCGSALHLDCAAARNPAVTMLGGQQEKWVIDALTHSRAQWKAMANQSPFVQMLRSTATGQRGYHTDKWDGYVASRDRIQAVIERRNIANVVVLTGDSHQNFVAELKADYADPRSASLGVEFMGTSISSGTVNAPGPTDKQFGDGVAMSPFGTAVLKDNPHFHYYNGQRGYVRCVVTPQRWTADYRIISRISEPGGSVRTDASFTVEAGRARVSL